VKKIVPVLIASDVTKRIALFLENRDLLSLANSLRQFRYAAVEELIKRELINYKHYKLSEMEKRLIICAKLGMTEWVSKYIDAGVNIHVSIKIQNHDVQPIHFAALSGVVSCVKILVNANAILFSQKPTRYYLSPLHFAAAGGNPACVEYLVDQGIPVDQESPELFWLGSQYTALKIAALHKKRTCAEMLISKNADLHHAGMNDVQAIHVAAGIPNNTTLIKLLVLKGANPNSKMTNGWSPLMLAMRDIECHSNIQELLTGGANPREPNIFNQGKLPLQVLITYKLLAAASILLEFDSSLIDAVVPRPSNCRSVLEWLGDRTALHIAVLLNYKKEVIFLLERNADTEIKTKKGKKAIDLVNTYDEGIKGLLQKHTISLCNEEAIESKPSSICRGC
jgi:ankyrin repeat protein